MSSPQQIAANQQNSQKSTGPTSLAGKETVSKNALTHGLTGTGFVVLPSEDRGAYETLCTALLAEHNPATLTETILVTRLAQHHWLAQRAIRLQQLCFDDQTAICSDEKQLAVYLRYQTTHERAFHKCLSDLLKLKAEARKAQNGFVSQEEKEAAQQREIELHEAKVRLAHARAQTMEIDSDIRQTIEAPLPGHMRIPFEDICDAMKVVVNRVNEEFRAELANKKAA